MPGKAFDLSKSGPEVSECITGCEQTGLKSPGADAPMATHQQMHVLVVTAVPTPWLAESDVCVAPGVTC